MREWYNDFKEGLAVASRSFWYVWQHVELMSYLGIGAAVYAAFQFFLYVRFPQATDGFVTLLCLHKTMPEAVLQYHLINHIFMCFETFFYVFLLLLLNVWLIRHTLVRMQGEMLSWKYLLHLNWTHTKRISAWAAIMTLIVAGLRLVSLIPLSYFWYVLLLVLVLFGILAWTLATFFVLPLLATSQLPIRESCAQSYELAKETKIEILGAEVWLAIVTFLSLGLLMVISNLTASLCHTLPTLLTFIFIAGAGALCAFIATTQAVVKCMFFYTYYLIPNKQLQFLEYQMFWPI